MGLLSTNTSSSVSSRYVVRKRVLSVLIIIPNQQLLKKFWCGLIDVFVPLKATPAE